MAITLGRGGTQSGSISGKAGMSSQAGKVGISGKAGMSSQAGKSGMTGKLARCSIGLPCGGLNRKPISTSLLIWY